GPSWKSIGSEPPRSPGAEGLPMGPAPSGMTTSGADRNTVGRHKAGPTRGYPEVGCGAGFIPADIGVLCRAPAFVGGASAATLFARIPTAMPGVRPHPIAAEAAPTAKIGRAACRETLSG